MGHTTRNTLLAGLIAFSTPLAGCSFDSLTQTVDNSVDKTLRSLDGAIQTLDQNSSSWQSTLKDLQSQLTADAQSTVRNEVTTLLTRGIATLGSELRCDTDFIGKRMLQALRRLRAELLGQNYPVALEPVICQIAPSEVDAELVRAGRLRALQIYGYDFDTSRIKLTLKETNAVIDESSLLAQPSHYQLTVPFGANGVVLSERSQQLLFSWNEKVQQTVSVLQPLKPVCKREVRDVFPMPPSMTLVPPHTRGDREFNSLAEIRATVNLFVNASTVTAVLYMRAYEPRPDYTTAEGNKTSVLYTVPPGYRIRSFLTPVNAEHSYTDNDWTIDTFAGSGPVRQWSFVGDTEGDEAGTRTQVTVDFLSRFQVELEQIENCLPQAGPGDSGDAAADPVNPDAPLDR